jgi:hypothetical protein
MILDFKVVRLESISEVRNLRTEIFLECDFYVRKFLENRKLKPKRPQLITTANIIKFIILCCWIFDKLTPFLLKKRLKIIDLSDLYPSQNEKRQKKKKPSQPHFQVYMFFLSVINEKKSKMCIQPLSFKFYVHFFTSSSFATIYTLTTLWSIRDFISCKQTGFLSYVARRLYAQQLCIS